MVERSLSMREVRGSMPRISICFLYEVLFKLYYLVCEQILVTHFISFSNNIYF